MKIEFEVIDPSGEIAHRGTFNLHATDERRAFAERVADAQFHGCEVRSWRSGQRPGQNSDDFTVTKIEGVEWRPTVEGNGDMAAVVGGRQFEAIWRETTEVWKYAVYEGSDFHGYARHMDEATQFIKHIVGGAA